MAESFSTATAHEFWDDRWQSESGRRGWSIPDPEVRACLEALQLKGFHNMLDLGSGAGRHALLMAEMGFSATALDASPTGLDYLARQARLRHLDIRTVEGHMCQLPFRQGEFDFVLAVNVIYHGDEAEVRRTIGEIHRVLRPGGVFQGTLLSKRHREYGLGREISRNTFIQEHAPNSDRDHPHHYCSASEAIDLLEGFEVRRMVDREQKRPGQWHWYFEAERLELQSHG
jgi:SAM-dependent methyltransferase